MPCCLVSQRTQDSTAAIISREESGSRLISGAQNLTPFTSAEKNIFSADLSLSWNVLDFGLSYIRAKQAADDVLIAEEERRRVANRVMQDVRTAYWRAVSAERILPSLKMLDEWVKNALEKSQAVQDEKLSTPLVPLQYRLDLLNTQRYVQQLFRELSTAKLQLAALINLPPGEEHKMMLLVPEREAGTLNLPVDLTVLEDRALEHVPELRHDRLPPSDQRARDQSGDPRNVAQPESPSRWEL